MIGIIDYGAGNIHSVSRALTSLGINNFISNDKKELAKASRFILSGVGHAKYAMQQLQDLNLIDFIRELFMQKVPLLGICLGFQLMFEHSSEGDTECLGLVSGKIRHFNEIALFESYKKRYKIPQMGWNNLQYQQKSELMAGIPQKTDFYFVHSYVAIDYSKTDIIATCDYGIQVPSIIHHDSMFACQFHPEKSGIHGLTILKNFSEYE